MSEQIGNISKEMETIQKCTFLSGKIQNLKQKFGLAAYWRQKKKESINQTGDQKKLSNRRTKGGRKIS